MKKIKILYFKCCRIKVIINKINNKNNVVWELKYVQRKMRQNNRLYDKYMYF